jgi:hypothetical protein
VKEPFAARLKLPLAGGLNTDAVRASLSGSLAPANTPLAASLVRGVSSGVEYAMPWAVGASLTGTASVKGVGWSMGKAERESE